MYALVCLFEWYRAGNDIMFGFNVWAESVSLVWNCCVQVYALGGGCIVIRERLGFYMELMSKHLLHIYNGLIIFQGTALANLVP